MLQHPAELPPPNLHPHGGARRLEHRGKVAVGAPVLPVGDRPGQLLVGDHDINRTADQALTSWLTCPFPARNVG